MSSFSVRANLVDINARGIFPAEVVVVDGRIASIDRIEGVLEGYLMPGFVDAHVHVESSMLIPSEFARAAVVHGTVGTVSDPHEIANVLGVKGVEFMIANGKQVPFHFCFGAPSCVPATAFETAGAHIDAEATGRLLAHPDIGYLAEMMNFPGVLDRDPEVMAKIAHAHRLGKPIDGHAPGLKGDTARRYIAAGITTDHECFTREEALDKLAAGMKILIREGSAAKNFDALIGLMHDHAENLMFCSDDKHPDGLVLGHIDLLCARAVALGHDLFDVLRVACLNPVAHYRMPVGGLQVGDPADFILVEDLVRFKVRRTWIKGRLVAEEGRSLIPRVAASRPNRFDREPISEQDIRVPAQERDLLVIEALDGQLITQKRWMPPTIVNGNCVADTGKDLLKIVVVNRYGPRAPAVGWVTNFGFTRGAIAGSVAHDSHNIVAVGVSDADIVAAINRVILERGGISLADGASQHVLPLPVAGIMSDADVYEVAEAYARIDHAAKELGGGLAAPYMTLSFMALLVIPHLKMSDLGLFDGDTFSLLAEEHR